MTIDADNQDTWPKQLRDILTRDKDAIRSYHQERARIDRAAEGDVMLRLNRPANIYSAKWRSTLEIAEAAVLGQMLLAFHATRLTATESEAIQTCGLEVLSPDLLNRRLDALRQAGAIDANIFTALSGRHQAADENRANKIWFVFSKDTLQDESGMERFYRSWGGEALYNSHERHPTTGPALLRPGTPAIVQAAVPCDELRCFMGVGARLVNIWCESQHIRTGHGAAFEGYTTSNVPPEHILRIDHLGSDRFDQLTKHGEWRRPLAR